MSSRAEHPLPRTPPSQTPVGLAWLENFTGPDVDIARVLLDSLRFVSLSTMNVALKRFLDDLVSSGAIGIPALVLPERSLDDFHQMADGVGPHPVAFRDFDPGEPLSVTPGSEGFVGGLLRDFAEAGRRALGSPWIAPDAGLEDLRAIRCRSIVLVTDYIGSGKQILELVSAITRHPTIRSWRSLRLLRIHIVAFAAPPAALAGLRATKTVDEVWASESAPTFATTPLWTDEVRDAIRDLCRAESRIGDQWALGYKESAGLFATERGVPNNLPAVFWQHKKGWRGLFPWRKVPPEVAEQLSDVRPPAPLPKLAARVGQLRIGRNRRIDSMPKTSQGLLKLLVLLGQRPRSPEVLAAELSLEIRDAVALTGALQRLRLIDADMRITEAGGNELNATKRARRCTTGGIAGADVPYYPQSLR